MSTGTFRASYDGRKQANQRTPINIPTQYEEGVYRRTEHALCW